MLNTFLAEQAQKQARLMQHQVKKNRQTKDIAIQCTRSPRTVEVAVQTDIPDIMEDPWEQVKSPTKIVAELTEMKGREKIPSLLVLSNSDLTFINQDNDNFVEETPPHAPPAAITSPIIVPEPQVPQPVSAPSSLHTYPQTQMWSPLSTIARNSQVFFTSPSLQTSRSKRWRPSSFWAKKWYPLPWCVSMHCFLTKSSLTATRLEATDTENLTIWNFVFLCLCFARSTNLQCSWSSGKTLSKK